MLTLENDLVPFTNNHRSRNLRISQSAVFSVVPKSADCEGLVYIFVWASKSMLPFHLHLSPQTLSFLQKHFSSQKGMYSDRSGWLWVRILPHLPSVWVTPIWYRNLIVVAPPFLSKSMFWRRMWQKMEVSFHIHKFIVTCMYSYSAQWIFQSADLAYISATFVMSL